jgi:hypothetical protein
MSLRCRNTGGADLDAVQAPCGQAAANGRSRRYGTKSAFIKTGKVFGLAPGLPVRLSPVRPPVEDHTAISVCKVTFRSLLAG